MNDEKGKKYITNEEINSLEENVDKALLGKELLKLIAIFLAGGIATVVSYKDGYRFTPTVLAAASIDYATKQMITIFKEWKQYKENSINKNSEICKKY